MTCFNRLGIEHAILNEPAAWLSATVPVHRGALGPARPAIAPLLTFLQASQLLSTHPMAARYAGCCPAAMWR